MRGCMSGCMCDGPEECRASDALELQRNETRHRHRLTRGPGAVFRAQIERTEKPGMATLRIEAHARTLKASPLPHS